MGSLRDPDGPGRGIGRLAAACLLAAGAFLPELTGGLQVVRDPDGRGFPRRVAEAEIRTLEGIARTQRRRQRLGSGLSARQAAWLAVKAEYALHLGEEYDSPRRGRALAARKAVHGHCGRLLYAAHQSAQGMAAIAEEPGARLRAYESEVDRSLQTYSVSVPPGYDAERRWPLIVSLHGHGWFRPYQGHPAPSLRGAVVLSPQGRGATDYQGLGELDVLRAIDEVERDFSIDADRVYLTGSSMGGTGAFHLGVHYADRFAGILPIAGNADHRAWTAEWGWNQDFPGRNRELRDWLQDSQSAAAFAGNLQHLPVYVIAGSADTVVPPGHSRSLVDRLRRNRFRVEYREFPGCGHGGFPPSAVAEALAWTCGWRRDRDPREVHWKADSLRHGRAYWLRMEQMAAPLKSAEIHGRIAPGNRVEIRTANLLSFSIHCRNSLFDSGRPLILSVDGQKVIFPPWRDGPERWRTVCCDVIHGWDWQEHLRIPEPRKVRGLEGPVQDALLSPFLVVVGTRSPVEGMNACWRREAEGFRREWLRRNSAPCPMVEDLACTQELMDGRNLVLFGGPRDNSVSALLDGSLPLQEVFEPLGGGREYLERDDVGCILAYPAGSCSPGCLAVVLSANAPAAADQLWGRFGNWFDWGVHDSRKYFDYAVFDSRSSSPETMLAVGWFGTDWRIGTGRVFLGDPALRSANGRRSLPKYDSVRQCPSVLDLRLTDLRPETIDQMRGAVGWNVTFWGRPLPGCRTGLGIRAPSSLTFRIGGRYREFAAVAALDQVPGRRLTARRRASERVRFILWGDGVRKGEALVDWEEPEKELRADVSGVEELVLEARPDGGPSWLHAGALWKDPVVGRWRLPRGRTPGGAPEGKNLE